MDALLNNFFREIDEIDTNPDESQATGQESKVERLHNYEVSGTSWVPCFDGNTGCPYYWNQLTNEVCWQPPPEYIAAVHAARKQQEVATVASTKKANAAVKKPQEKLRPKYPWESNSDSEDEKVELITSFGPQSEDESEEDVKPIVKKPPKSRTRLIKSRKKVTPTGVNPKVQQSTSSIEEQSEVYETSSLLAPLVVDQGPPGDENIRSNVNGKDVCNERVKDVVQSTSNSSAPSEDETSVVDCEDILTRLKNKAKILEKLGGEVPSSVKEYINPPQVSLETNDKDSEIKQRDQKPVQTESQVMLPTNSFALIANYGDDSDTEEVNNTPEKPPSEPEEPKALFPSVSSVKETVTPKLLFPCVEELEKVSVTTKPLFPSVCEEEPPVEALTICSSKILPKSSTTSVAEQNFNAVEVEDVVAVKAFKRKRRIQIDKPKESHSKYNLDPSSNDHRGFGFSTIEIPNKETEVSSSYSINFVKGEIINLNPTLPTEENGPAISTEETNIVPPLSPVKDEEIGDRATLVREKLMFLGEGTEEMSAVQQMAIQLETLVFAWQQGALTPMYLSQWLIGRASELSEKEQTAAPPGWTCSWDRERKRYSYRNQVTDEVVWDYPECIEDAEKAQEPKIPEETKETAMELSQTPPRISSIPSSPEPEREPSPPPPPVISERVVTPPPPPPPMISLQQIDNSIQDSIDDPSSICVPPPPNIALNTEKTLHLTTSNNEPLPPGVEEIDFEIAPVAIPPAIISAAVPPKNEQASDESLGSRKRSLRSELDSFYSDIAQLEADHAVNVPEEPPIVAPSVPPVVSLEGSTYLFPSSSQTETQDRPPTKKKKSNKLSTGLSLKKKGVNNLVAQWLKVQNEARKGDESN